MTIEETLAAIRERADAGFINGATDDASPAATLGRLRNSQADVAPLLAAVEAVLKLDSYTVHDPGLTWSGVDAGQLREAIEENLGG